LYLYVLRLLLVPLLIAASCFAQAPPTTASVTGIVRMNGAPAASLLVTLTDVGGSEINHCETDASGRYSFSDIIPGRVQLRFTTKSGMQDISTLNLKAGPNPNLNITLVESVRVSGKVNDQNRQPLKGVTVLLMYAEYAVGALRYFPASSAVSNDAGEYTIVAPPRDSFFVLARKTGQMPTYYPGTESINGAVPLTLTAGGKRDLVDIQMKAAPSRCLEGTIVTPDGEKPSAYEIGENDPPLWTPSARFTVNARAPAGDDGKFKVCDLHPGDYWIKTYSSGDPQRSHAIEYVTIGDKDVAGIVTGPKPQFPVEVLVMWDRLPSEDSQPVKMSVGVGSTIGEFGGLSVTVENALPGHFSVPVTNHGYVLSVRNFPAGAYLKDVTYAGHSILNEVFEPGSGPAADGLRIVLARDGARVSLKAADKDGNSIPNANIAVIPSIAVTEAAAATAMVTAQTDAYGSWTSAPIAPGKYYVIATTSPVNRSRDVFDKLWRARSSSDIVDLGPNATTQVTRTPGAIE
jgi:hypothetical protein